MGLLDFFKRKEVKEVLQKPKQVVSQRKVRYEYFEESLLQTGYTEYIDEILVYGTDKEKRELYENNNAEILRIQKRLEKLTTEERVPKRRTI